ncbi:hypothetical protein M231_03585 [Tremella mesenterica]|uniref:Uncharacterized protein n=1 Tax=Tremella mesenterica TaxID=5217 RepID=A0A4Q1BMW7_TREME|nr:uncharacterized protein TREMEDRAFT_59480 [Tremella mesenterica DSM 1558]EIW73316.1 hypothetical protein TREMEDRAFT_59480 [Tremella mesenterica DSM 1558]RXK39080.1 hypothetical protein M231_03585 [Tremella mesenterica]
MGNTFGGPTFQLPLEHLFIGFDGSSIEFHERLLEDSTTGGDNAMRFLQETLTAIFPTLTANADSGIHIIIAGGMIEIHTPGGGGEGTALPKLGRGDAVPETHAIFVLPHSCWPPDFVTGLKNRTGSVSIEARVDRPSIETLIDVCSKQWAGPKSKTTLTVLVTENLKGLLPRLPKARRKLIKRKGSLLILKGTTDHDPAAKQLGVTVISMPEIFQ